jgi:hypothetical protein
MVLEHHSQLELLNFNNMQNDNLKNEIPTCDNTGLATVQFKVNDVFSFRYNEEETKKRFEPYHCFDGQFIVKQRENGELYLMDTYWASKYDGFKHWSDYKWKTIEDAQKQGTLTFICNLDEVEEIQEHDLQYYADEDLFNLSYQHGCCKFYVKRKGAKRSIDKMLQSIRQKIEDEHSKIRSAENSLKWLNETLKKIEAGDTSVYL